MGCFLYKKLSVIKDFTDNKKLLRRKISPSEQFFSAVIFRQKLLKPYYKLSSAYANIPLSASISILKRFLKRAIIFSKRLISGSGSSSVRGTIASPVFFTN